MRIPRALLSAVSAGCLAVIFAESAHPATMVFDLRKPAQQSDVRRYMIQSPRPPYPMSARRHRRTGSGVYRVIFNRRGRVVAVTALQSTGHEDLDQAAAYGFYRWRCKPGTIDQIIVPVTFTDDSRHARESEREQVY